MPLSKLYTAKKVNNVLRSRVNQLDPNKVQDLTLEDYINISVADVVEMLGEEGELDYGASIVISDVGTSVASGVVTGATYITATRTINKNAHGLTVADVGKFIVYYDDTAEDKLVVAQIESITDVDNFVVTKDLGADAALQGYYLLAHHSASYCDLSALNIDKIIKVVGSTANKDGTRAKILKVGTDEFENLPNLEDKQDNVWFNKIGEQLHLYKGEGVAEIGTITLYYKRQPTPVIVETDYLDIKDKYIPLVIAKCKAMVYEQLEQTPPEALTNAITSRTAMIRESNLAENAQVKGKKVEFPMKRGQ
jgi:hypothetical protein